MSLEEEFQHLEQSLIDYDLRNATRARYGRGILPDLLQRLEEIHTDVIGGRPTRQALIAGFRGHIQTVLLASVGQPPATAAEKRGVYYYRPQ